MLYLWIVWVSALLKNVLSWKHVRTAVLYVLQCCYSILYCIVQNLNVTFTVQRAVGIFWVLTRSKYQACLALADMLRKSTSWLFNVHSFHVPQHGQEHPNSRVARDKWKCHHDFIQSKATLLSFGITANQPNLEEDTGERNSTSNQPLKNIKLGGGVSGSVLTATSHTDLLDKV